MNKKLEQALEEARNVVILGHQHPDGDCIGSTLGLYNYLRDTRPSLETAVYLDNPDRKFDYLPRFGEAETVYEPEKSWDLCIALDASSPDRLGDYLPYFEGASRTFCIDHHVTNPGIAMENIIDPKASSASEVLFDLLSGEDIGKNAAVCLYTGIVHDTGVFKYSCTSKRTMEAAGALIAYGLDTTEIIDGSFYRKTFTQNHLLGLVLCRSELLCSGKMIYSWITAEEMKEQGGGSNDLDGIIDQLRITEGVEFAAFAYEKTAGEWKISLRSNHCLDVAAIALRHAGGGHVRAAGCTMYGTPDSIREELVSAAEESGCFTA